MEEELSTICVLSRLRGSETLQNHCVSFRDSKKYLVVHLLKNLYDHDLKKLNVTGHWSKPPTAKTLITLSKHNF